MKQTERIFLARTSGNWKFVSSWSASWEIRSGRIVFWRSCNNSNRICILLRCSNATQSPRAWNWKSGGDRRSARKSVKVCTEVTACEVGKVSILTYDIIVFDDTKGSVRTFGCNIEGLSIHNQGGLSSSSIPIQPYFGVLTVLFSGDYLKLLPVVPSLCRCQTEKFLLLSCLF